MNDIVPGALQRLREADIVGLAGLASASLGQEYGRSGYVSVTQRQGVRLSGIVALPASSSEPLIASPEQAGELPLTSSLSIQRFEVEVEVANRISCRALCTCGSQTTWICAHAAALLYQWIYRPYLFTALFPPSEEDTAAVLPDRSDETTPVVLNTKLERASEVEPEAYFNPLPSRTRQVSTVDETLSQLGLSELRAVAREYGIVVTNLGKQQLMETMIETLSQPEAVRRVVGLLAKAERQLLAACALAGGLLSDEELRGLFERFGLEHAGTLQDMLVTLQAKLLLVRTNQHQSSQPRSNAHLSALDISWYIPREMREALHVTLPVTALAVDLPYGKNNPTLPLVRLAEPYRLLADMLLIARMLDGVADGPAERRSPRGSAAMSARLAADGSLALPPPEGDLAGSIIETLQTAVSRPRGLLAFAARLLRQSGMLYKEENWAGHLRLLPQAAKLLLGPERDGILHELFRNWVTQASYAELFDLAESGTRIRCRATPLNQPALRRGELELENSEARQELLALLIQVPPGEWINLSAFARFIYRLHPTFLQRRQQLFPSPHWWIEHEEGQPLHPAQLVDWLRGEGRYLAELIQGPLHWLGICDLAFSASEQLLGFRLTPLGNGLFRGQPIPEVEVSASGEPNVVLTVSADEQLLIPCLAANWPMIACIEDFAESTGVQQEKLSYSMSARSLSQAISQGRDPHDLQALLKRSLLREENLALRQLLGSLERRIASYGRVRLYTDVSLMQVADAAVMQQLDALTSLDEQVVRAIHPTLLMLKKQGLEQLLEELKRRGQAPLLHEER